MQLGSDQRILLLEFLWVDLLCVHRRKDPKTVIGKPHVVPVARTPCRDDSAAVSLTHQLRQERRDHRLLLGHTPEPRIRFNGHYSTRGLSQTLPSPTVNFITGPPA